MFKKTIVTSLSTLGAALLVAASAMTVVPAHAEGGRTQGAFILQNDRDGQNLSWASIEGPGGDAHVEVNYHPTKPRARSLVDFPAMTRGNHGPIRGVGPFSTTCFTTADDRYEWKPCDGSPQQDFEWQKSDIGGNSAAAPGSWVLKNTGTPFFIGHDFPLGPTQSERDANIIRVAEIAWEFDGSGRVEGDLIYQHDRDGRGWSWGWVEPPHSIGEVTVHYSPTRPTETHGDVSFPVIAEGSHGAIRGTNGADNICLTEYPGTSYQWAWCDGSLAQDFLWEHSPVAGLEAASPGSWTIRSLMSNNYLGAEAPLRPTDQEEQGNIIRTGEFTLNNVTARITSIDHQQHSVALAGKTGEPGLTVNVYTPDGRVVTFTSDAQGAWHGTISGLNSGENVLYVTQVVDGVVSSPVPLTVIIDQLAVALVDPIILAGAGVLLLAAITGGLVVRQRRRARN